jgi:hypothetical protein
MTGTRLKHFQLHKLMPEWIKGISLLYQNGNLVFSLSVISPAVFSPQQGAMKWTKVGNYARLSFS